MSRQINLYSSEFRRQRKPFSAAWIIVSFVASVSLTSAYYFLVASPLPEMRARRVDAAAQAKAIRDELVNAGKNSQKTGNKLLEDQVTRAEVQLKSRQDLVGRLQGSNIGNRDGYSKYLLALARQHTEGLWLTSIEVSGPVDEFTVRGQAQRAAQVSEYIKALRREEAFRGRPIGTLSLNEREIEVPGGKGAAQDPASGSRQQAAAPIASKVRTLEFVIGTGVTAVEDKTGK